MFPFKKSKLKGNINWTAVDCLSYKCSVTRFVGIFYFKNLTDLRCIKKSGIFRRLTLIYPKPVSERLRNF